MKCINRYKTLMGLLSMACFIWGCFEEPVEEDSFEPFTKVSFPYSAATWSTIDDLVIEIDAPGLTSANVLATGGDRAIDLGVITFADGVAHLSTSWSELSGASIIEVTGEDAKTGSKFMTSYSVTEVSAVSIGADKEAHNDTLVTVTIAAETIESQISGLSLWKKEGEGDFVEVSSATSINSLTYTDTYAFTVPGEDELFPGQTISFKVVISSNAGLSEEVEFDQVVAPIVLTSEGVISLVTDGSNAFSFADLSVLPDSLLADSHEDLLLVIEGESLHLLANAVSNTTFARSSELSYADANFNTVKRAFESVEASTTVSDLGNLPEGTFIMVKIGGMSGASQYAAIQLAGVVNASASSRTVTLRYKALIP